MPDRMPEGMPDKVPDRMPDKMSDRMPEDMPDKVPECLPDRMPEDMPGRMPEDMPDRMPGRMPEDMPDRMPDRMPEDMSARMPEDLPVTKCINVMVGITRSKAIWVFWCFLFGLTLWKPLCWQRRTRWSRGRCSGENWTPTDGSRKGHGSERAGWGSTGGSERRDLGNPKTGSCLLICVYISWLLIFADVCWCLLTCGLVDSSLGWFWVGP